MTARMSCHLCSKIRWVFTTEYCAENSTCLIPALAPVNQVVIHWSTNGHSLVNQWSITSQPTVIHWSTNGHSLVNQRSFTGQPMVIHWSTNYQSLVNQWSITGQLMVSHSKHSADRCRAITAVGHSALDVFPHTTGYCYCNFKILLTLIPNPNPNRNHNPKPKLVSLASFTFK